MRKSIQKVEKWNLRLLIRLFVTVGLILALVSSYLGYTRLFLNSERRFWSAIENSMSTPSVTRTLTSGGSGNQVVQKQQLLFGAEPKIFSQVVFEQRGATDNTKVVTEGIAFTDEQYSRYTMFTTDQLQPDGSVTQIDDLLNRWEVLQSSETGSADLTRQNFVGELVSLAIFGNYSSDFRNDVISALKDNGVYNVNFDSVERQEGVDGDVRIYPATVQLRAFAEQLTAAFIEAGYGEFPPLDPENFDPNADLQVVIEVSERTGAITSLSYGSRQEQYSGYGIQKNVQRPEAEFSNGELEEQVQEALNGVL